MEEKRRVPWWAEAAIDSIALVATLLIAYGLLTSSLPPWQRMFALTACMVFFVWVQIVVWPSGRKHRYIFAIVVTLLFGAALLLGVEPGSDWEFTALASGEFSRSLAVELTGAIITFFLISIIWDTVLGREDRRERERQHAELVEKMAALEAKLDARTVSLEAALEALRRSEEED